MASTATTYNNNNIGTDDVYGSDCSSVILQNAVYKWFLINTKSSFWIWFWCPGMDFFICKQHRRPPLKKRENSPTHQLNNLWNCTHLEIQTWFLSKANNLFPNVSNVQTYVFQESSFLLPPLPADAGNLYGCPWKQKPKATSVNRPIHALAIKLFIMHRNQTFEDKLVWGWKTSRTAQQ